ncbi:FtsB/FtsL family cell division protein [Granulicella mallensis]|jgi:cell division protein FtsL|uniref:Cell division protein FtsL n=1 Tax=Granulicella mallensis (strain ATCC BAA-1857 / DSM 23137 / MP5ACTX8) TaxID=682795 RepID=G8P223_GRAMM|nr:cell division protein FtsL [Granulicella mallensis]AEU38169.1 cell division protein FtsL [Granulicella mallensis MP5ACTX8]
MATMAMAGQEMERMHTRRSAGSRAAGRTNLAERNRELYELQRPRRRGPTPEMFFTKHIDNSRIVKADDPERRREMRSFTIVMTLFFALTMVYVWQHFSAIEVGYRVEAQKTQVEQMRETNRQLRLTEAQLSDPGRIDRIAKQLGLDAPSPGQVVRPDGSSVSAPVLAQAHIPALSVN